MKDIKNIKCIIELPFNNGLEHYALDLLLECICYPIQIFHHDLRLSQFI